jgi:undecaprenyl-diphosphatase
MNMFSVALVAAFFFGGHSVWFFLVAALVSYSRIYTGSHWPSDILTSIFIACGTTLLMLAALDWLWRRRGEALLPRLHARHPSLFAA